VSLLQHAEFKIKKEAAWAISYAVSGGSHEQIQYVSIYICSAPTQNEEHRAGYRPKDGNHAHVVPFMIHF